MSALCDKIYDLTITCPECGMTNSTTSDYQLDVLIALGWIKDHMRTTHKEEDDE